MRFYLGIDFGAENIMVSYLKEGEDGRGIIHFGSSEIMKNCYAVDADGREYYGQEARNIYDESEDIRFFSRYKKYLGQRGADLPGAFQGEYLPGDILAKTMTHILSYIKNHLKTNLGIPEVEILNTTVTVPIGWELDNVVRQVYTHALTRAGLENFRLVAEPVAAAANLILTLKAHEDWEPGKNDNILVVDMGASTLDVSVCAFTDHIIAKKGIHTYYAGNYCDALIASAALGISPDEIEKDMETFTDILDEAQQIKETAKPRQLKKGKSLETGFINLDQMNAITETLVEKTARTVSGSLAELGEKKIHQMILCGGMSRLRFDFLPNLEKRIRDMHPSVFSNCLFLNARTDLDDKLKHFTICYGASLLAKDPELVIETLDYDIGIQIKVLDDADQVIDAPQFFLIPKGTRIEKNNNKYSLLKAVHREKPGVMLSIDRVEKIPFSILLRRGDAIPRCEEIYIRESFDVTRVDPEFKVKKRIPFDFWLSLDENGILHIDIEDLHQNKIVANARFKRLRPNNTEGIYIRS